MTFENDLKRYVVECRKMSEQRFRRIGMLALRRIVTRTPVLTGTARANWNITLNQSNYSSNLGKNDISGGQTITGGQAVIYNAKLGNDIHFANTVPYIEMLENGWSKQQGRGFMVSLTIEELKSLISRDLI